MADVQANTFSKVNPQTATWTTNMASNFTAGNSAFVVLCAYQFAGPNTFTCTIGGDAATLAVEAGEGADRRTVHIYYVKTLTGGSSAIVIGGMTDFTYDLRSGVLEINDGLTATPVDQTNAVNTAATTVTPTTAATTQASEIVFAGCEQPTQGGATTMSLPADYTSLFTTNGATSAEGVACYKRISSTGAQSASFSTGTAVTATAAIVTFKLAAAAAGGGNSNIFLLL